MSDDTEFTDLVDRHYGALYRFALSLTGLEADACDLVQETFYIWVRKRNQIRDPSRVKSWLFTTMHREFLRSRRRGSRFPHVEITVVEAELPVLDPVSWNQTDGKMVVGCIQRIDEVFRAPLALFYLDDLSYDEISRVLELPLGTVKSRLSRGIAQLRGILAGDIRSGKEAANE